MMTNDERARLLRDTLDAAWNRGEVDLFSEVYAPNCTFHNPTFPLDGVSGMADFVLDLRAAAPNVHVDVHDVVVGDDMAAHRFTLGGTNQREFRGVPATGKPYVISGITMTRWQDDRIVEEWHSFDMLGLLQQIGVLPETTPAGADAEPVS